MSEIMREFKEGDFGSVLYFTVSCTHSYRSSDRS